MAPAASVLVVEDDEDLRELTVEAIRATRRIAYGAGEGREALELLSVIPRPCLILLDMAMHPMSGRAFLDELAGRADKDEFIVIATSGDAAALQGVPGVAGTMRKPFQLQDLSATLDRYLGPRP